MTKRWLRRTGRWLGWHAPRPPYGLALSGGATLGAAHVGALRAIDEAGLEIHCISGTSIGAVAAAMRAFGVPLDDIRRVALDMNWMAVSRFRPNWLGLLSNRKLGDILHDHIGDPDFSEAGIPLAVIAADISTGERVVLREGPVVPAVLASTCVPGIFQPMERDGRLLVDGGIVENLPTSVLPDLGARSIIGVDLNARRHYQPPSDLIDVILNATDIAINNATRLQTDKGTDLLITPSLSAYSRFRSGMGEQILGEGYTATRDALAIWLS